MAASHRPDPAIQVGHWAIGDTVAVLQTIRRPDVTLAVWRRTLAPGLAADLDALCAGHDFHVDTQVKEGIVNVPGCFAQVPKSAAVDMLRRDIACLVTLFARAIDSPVARLRLETVVSDSCRLFHVDASSLRLLVTYSGHGTQWVANDDVHRDEMGLRGRTFEQANDAIVPRREQIRVIHRFSVALLKGEGYPGNLGNGLVHRSPPIRQSGLRRLRLCLDTEAPCHG
jgi:hypothetical protein